ncbi:MAG: SAM-dependent methyltransferase [Gammaproteobacteria bacterium]|nr:SAM-dependent methyltransferase [Gammaproteobacteria bacterium]
MNDLPEPSAEALALSQQLVAVIREEIAAGAGSIPFSRYMELCLYSPGLGYYSAGSQKFGAAGDFITAPELSSLFGRCLAQSCASVLVELGGGDILEFGAGSGRLAADILGELETAGHLPGQYCILERSAELRARQQETLVTQVPQLFERVVWLDALPQANFRGVLLANEVLDAMPVERFRWNGTAVELFHVSGSDEPLDWCPVETHGGAVAADVRHLVTEAGLAAGYVSEINMTLAPWLGSIAALLDQGMVLLADYGYPRHEYYHPQRSAGTLMCHYRHRAHDNPFLWPGLQDITAHVDFTAVAEAGSAAGLDVTGYTTQVHFLLDCGIDRLLSAVGPSDSVDYLKQAQQVKQLLLPGEMGERFKFIGLTRDIENPIPGFRLQNFLHRL